MGYYLVFLLHSFVPCSLPTFTRSSLFSSRIHLLFHPPSFLLFLLQPLMSLSFLFFSFTLPRKHFLSPPFNPYSSAFCILSFISCSSPFSYLIHLYSSQLFSSIVYPILPFHPDITLLYSAPSHFLCPSSSFLPLRLLLLIFSYPFFPLYTLII